MITADEVRKLRQKKKQQYWDLEINIISSDLSIYTKYLGSTEVTVNLDIDNPKEKETISQLNENGFFVKRTSPYNVSISWEE